MTSHSIRLFPVLGIPVHLHASFFVLALFLMATGGGFSNPAMAVHLGMFLAVMLASTLAHELGHCLAARGEGGSAEDITLWGMGGLAHVDHPQRPGSSLRVSLAGVGVNALLALMAAATLRFRDGSLGAPTLMGGIGQDPLSMLYGFNACIFALNLLPGLPFDGGLATEALLWKPLGRLRARKVVLVTGTLGGLGLLMWGVAQEAPLLTALGLWALYGCGQSYQRLREGEIPEVEDPLFGAYDFSRGYTSIEDSAPEPAAPPRRKEPRRPRRDRAAEEKAAREAAQARLDLLLERIHAEGLDSLTDEERKFLDQESERLRANRPS